MEAKEFWPNLLIQRIDVGIGLGPVCIRIERRGFIDERYMLDGKLHREGGPAAIRRDMQTGAVLFEGWYHHGELHREDGPAWIEFSPAPGLSYSEKWFRDGKLHRDDGPAVTHRGLKGGLAGRRWFRDNVMIDPPARPAGRRRPPTPPASRQQQG